MAKTWTAVVITGAAELADSLSSFLLDQGAPGVQTEELGEAIRVTAHFVDPPSLEVVEAYCRALPSEFAGVGVPQVRCESIADGAWAESWKEHFPPLEVGDRLFVHPPWVDELPAGRIGIRIDPGMAFGTGQHASTRGCLVLLERALHSTRRARVLDLGTGSGILAIAAAKLGGREVYALDIDTDACAVAMDNIAMNGVADRIHILDSLQSVTAKFEIILANLFAPQLVELTDEIIERLAPGGWVIGSGILLEEAASVIDAWKAAGLRLETQLPEGEWVTVAFRDATDASS